MVSSASGKVSDKIVEENGRDHTPLGNPVADFPGGRSHAFIDAHGASATEIHAKPAHDVWRKSRSGELVEKKVQVDGVERLGDVEGDDDGAARRLHLLKAFGDFRDERKKRSDRRTALPEAMLMVGGKKRSVEGGKK